ncbi:hypothetical protein RA29_19680 [Tateyamaria sp. ANG-S1]|nr:hypothetical protein RA29_19680 [Tateyamaria sp. ANG-S1]
MMSLSPTLLATIQPPQKQNLTMGENPQAASEVPSFGVIEFGFCKQMAMLKEFQVVEVPIG